MNRELGPAWETTSVLGRVETGLPSTIEIANFIEKVALFFLVCAFWGFIVYIALSGAIQ